VVFTRLEEDVSDVRRLQHFFRLPMKKKSVQVLNSSLKIKTTLKSPEKWVIFKAFFRAVNANVLGHVVNLGP